MIQDHGVVDQGSGSGRGNNGFHNSRWWVAIRMIAVVGSKETAFFSCDFCAIFLIYFLFFPFALDEYDRLRNIHAIARSIQPLSSCLLKRPSMSAWMRDPSEQLLVIGPITTAISWPKLAPSLKIRNKKHAFERRDSKC